MVKKTFCTEEANFYRVSYLSGYSEYYLDFAVENHNRFTVFGGAYYEWMFRQAIADIQEFERRR